MGQRLLGGIQAGADQHAVGTQHQRRGEPAAIGDPAGREHQHVRVPPRAQVPHLRHQGQRAAHRAVPAGLRTLGDDDLGADLERARRVRHGLDLADQRRARGAHLARERRRVAERQHDRARAPVQRLRQQLRLPRQDQVMNPQPTASLPAAASCASSQSASP